MHAIKHVLHLILFASCVVLSIGRSVAAEGTVVNYLVVEELSAPFQVVENGASKGGIISEIVDDLAMHANITINPIVGSTERIYRWIADHPNEHWITYDAKVWNSLAPYGNFLDEPLFQVTHSFLGCIQGASAIDTPRHILGKNITILKGFTYPELSKLESAGEIVTTPVKSYRQGFELISNNRADGFVEMDIRLKYNQTRFKDQYQNCVFFSDLSTLIAPYEIYLSVSHSLLDQYAAMLQNRIREMKNENGINKIIMSYTKR